MVCAVCKRPVDADRSARIDSDDRRLANFLTPEEKARFTQRKLDNARGRALLYVCLWHFATEDLKRHPLNGSVIGVHKGARIRHVSEEPLFQGPKLIPRARLVAKRDPPMDIRKYYPLPNTNQPHQNPPNANPNQIHRESNPNRPDSSSPDQGSSKQPEPVICFYMNTSTKEFCCAQVNPSRMALLMHANDHMRYAINRCRACKKSFHSLDKTKAVAHVEVLHSSEGTVEDLLDDQEEEKVKLIIGRIGECYLKHAILEAIPEVEAGKEGGNKEIKAESIQESERTSTSGYGQGITLAERLALLKDEPSCSKSGFGLSSGPHAEAKNPIQSQSMKLGLNPSFTHSPTNFVRNNKSGVRKRPHENIGSPGGCNQYPKLTPFSTMMGEKAKQMKLEQDGGCTSNPGDVLICNYKKENGYCRREVNPTLKDICGHMLMHMGAVSKTGVWICDRCSRIFSSKIETVAHIRWKHGHDLGLLEYFGELYDRYHLPSFTDCFTQSEIAKVMSEEMEM
ncbi:hypothetical protein Ddc_14537 [Ditylenchus destructor]|nr:hypothetical protein Ddc_14537 [Ditylenchus destructor]